MINKHIKVELKYIGIGIWVIFIIIVPILLGVFNQSQTSAGFWGSYIGGIIGTLGVVITTYFMISHDTNISKRNMILEDKRKRDLLLLDMKIKKNEEITECLLELNFKWVDLYNSLMDYSDLKEDYLDNKEVSGKELKDQLHDFRLKRKNFGDQINTLILHVKTFHDDDELKDFINKRDEVIEEYNRLENMIEDSKNKFEFIEISKRIENTKSEYEAYNAILTFYGEQYKAIINSINQIHYEE